MEFKMKNASVYFDFQSGVITSVRYKGVEICAKPSNLFNLRLTDKEGSIIDYSSGQAKQVDVKEDGKTVVYSGFPEAFSVVVF